MFGGSPFSNCLETVLGIMSTGPWWTSPGYVYFTQVCTEVVLEFDCMVGDY